MSNILYSSGDTPGTAIEQAIVDALDLFGEIREDDSMTERPIIDRDIIGVAVALGLQKPEAVSDNGNDVLVVAQIGDIPRPMPFETFLLKAASRAYAQRERGIANDTAPASELCRLAFDRLYEISSASAGGVHVGFAGGWAHHGRNIAAVIARSLADSMGLAMLEYQTGDQSLVLTDKDEIAHNAARLAQGLDSGDNTDEHIAERERYRFIFDLLRPSIGGA